MLDTSVCVQVLRKRPAGLGTKFDERASTLCTSTVVLFELFYGVENSPRPTVHRPETLDLIGRMAVLPFDEGAAAHAGEIRAVLTREGRMIGAYDLLIAGHARSRGLTVVTGKLGEFSRVDGLRCENWLANA